MNDEEINSILSISKTIAVVGLSRNPLKDSNEVASYLQS
jgi:predicted CoA-binding protein